MKDLTDTGICNVVIGYGSISTHSYCVLIGTGIKSTKDNQLIIGNSIVQGSRDLTDDEFSSLREALEELGFLRE